METVAVRRAADDERDVGRPVRSVWHRVTGPGPVTWVTVLSLHPAAKIASATAIERRWQENGMRRRPHRMRALNCCCSARAHRIELTDTDDSTSPQLGFGMLRFCAIVGARGHSLLYRRERPSYDDVLAALVPVHKAAGRFRYARPTGAWTPIGQPQWHRLSIADSPKLRPRPCCSLDRRRASPRRRSSRRD